MPKKKISKHYDDTDVYGKVTFVIINEPFKVETPSDVFYTYNFSND